jgi:hypothetical protein
MARKQGAIQKKMLVNKDQRYFILVLDALFNNSFRIKATSEVLSGIRVIKFFAWEGHIHSKHFQYPNHIVLNFRLMITL